MISQWASTNAQALVNSAGLLCDIVGAWLVAWEVVREYKGRRHNVSTGVAFEGVVVGQNVHETKEFTYWERSKYHKMRFGLAFLTVDFGLQFVSNWISRT